jgi:hypothetical protein
MGLAASLLTLAGLLAGQAPAAVASALDYEFFRSRVQPILSSKRPGHARCSVCHWRTSNFRLEPLPQGRVSWSEDESRRNFEAALRMVVPGDPLASRLLTIPLAEEAGGDPFHPGGKHWESQNDPDWRTLAAWVRSGAPPGPSSTASRTLDFELYRSRVEPIFLKLRAGGAGSCFACHSRINSRLRLRPLPPGAASWSEEQSRLNFEVVARLVAPGEPLKSRLLLHPLAMEAGGDAFHTGGKLWQSQEDPEWQTLADWVKTGSASSSAPAAAPPLLDFALYRSRIEPIFSGKRAGLARCSVCHWRTSNFRLQPLPRGRASWNEEESRRNFEAAQRMVTPGDPLASRLLTIPLAEEAGGDPFHPGGKHWQSQNDPEWQALAEWVRGRR